MLILSRKPGDAILIDGGIRIVVIACDGSGVRLGIEAPASVGILREEIVQGIADENVRAGATPEDKQFLDTLKPPRKDEPPQGGRRRGQ
jgi:carbon storage regulator